MCEICGQNPCDPRCPNAPDPEPVCTCDECGYGIFEGERFYRKDDGKIICMDCMENMNLDDLLDLFGIELETAEPYEPDYDDIGD